MRRLLPQLAVALAGGVAALLILGFVSTTGGDVGPGALEVSTGLRGGGRTELEVPPFGRVSARTHAAPLVLEASVERLDVDRIQRLLVARRPRVALQQEVEDDLGGLLARLALRSLLAAAVVGAVVGALVPGRRWTHAVSGGAGGVVAVGALLGVAWLTFDANGFRNARFEGPLSQAPRILETVRRHVDEISNVEDRLATLGDQVAELYAASTTEQIASSPGNVAVLHVSDIHSNPVGMELILQLAAQLGVDAVVDTGDLTSFGLTVESRVGDLIEDLDVPYYFVPGNHDSAANQRALGELGNVTVVDGEVVRIGRVRVLGVGSPVFTAENDKSDDEVDDALERQRARIARLLSDDDADVLAVHHPEQREPGVGVVGVAIAGHVHETTFDTEDGTVLLTAGSAGATGLGSFTVDTDLPYEAEVLRFDDRRLVAVDTISFEGVGGNFRIDRRRIPLDEEAAPSRDPG